jgi:GNAT superfamily N-acetyltransferase
MTVSSIVVRIADIAEAAIIAAFNIAMAHETEHRELDRGTALNGVQAVLEDRSKGSYYLAISHGVIVGQMLITPEWSDWRNGWFLWIQSVYVVPEHRRTGVFRALYEHAKELASSPGKCGLRLYVHRHNDAAIKTYSALGMTEAEYVMFEWEREIAQ